MSFDYEARRDWWRLSTHTPNWIKPSTHKITDQARFLSLLQTTQFASIDNIAHYFDSPYALAKCRDGGIVEVVKQVIWEGFTCCPAANFESAYSKTEYVVGTSLNLAGSKYK